MFKKQYTYTVNFYDRSGEVFIFMNMLTTMDKRPKLEHVRGGTYKVTCKLRDGQKKIVDEYIEKAQRKVAHNNVIDFIKARAEA